MLRALLAPRRRFWQISWVLARTRLVHRQRVADAFHRMPREPRGPAALTNARPMLTIAAHLARNGPVARRRDLLIHGFTDRDIRRAMVTGEVFRVRHGWHGARGTAAPVLRAVRIAGC